MGTWNIDSNGNSFVDSDALSWGDTPADAMDKALEDVIAAFRLDMGRAPTLEELHAGLAFSAEVALETDEEFRERESIYTFAAISEWTFPGVDGETQVSEECTYIDAKDADAARAIWETAEAGRKEWADNLTDQGKKILGDVSKVGVRLLSVEQIEPSRVKLKVVK